METWHLVIRQKIIFKAPRRKTFIGFGLGGVGTLNVLFKCIFFGQMTEQIISFFQHRERVNGSISCSIYDWNMTCYNNNIKCNCLFFKFRRLNENFEVVFPMPRKVIEKWGPRWPCLCASYRLHRRFWPERNLNVKFGEKVKSPPTLLLLLSQWGILATLIHVLHSFFFFLTLSQHSEEREWVHGGAGGELGKLHSVIVARLQSRQLTMLFSEIPQNLTTLEYHQTLSGCLWNATDTVWCCNLQTLKSISMLLK